MSAGVSGNGSCAYSAGSLALGLARSSPRYALTPPAVAVTLPVDVPEGGENVTWRPAAADSVPPVALQATSPVRLVSWAENAVGPEIATGPPVPDGVMVSAGSGSLSLHTYNVART